MPWWKSALHRHSSFLKDILLLADSWLIAFFLFSLLRTSQCFLASMVSEEKSAVALMKDSLCVVNHLHLATFKFLFWCGLCVSLITTCLGVDCFEFVLLAQSFS